ncbi:MAG: hypothetical protein CUN49_03005 [Candidatus Thermofonsia Clade 1 bacterium]|uniref:Uncharacterized protein n=1 Tax=Candidatus Thermofonsia Clade 1 bacterium TaxID=2364210 RepID=A0A2M8PH88_9CHLR|nr:MAG: hypothetical protein CUN49_03005 [Candidatus Thermofonsia Clade 1 bacterium]RMF51308.1 MAG: hypothetical protein D6749_08230 [Chloroflexota bacterium]
MIAEVLAQYIGVEKRKVERLLALKQEQIYEDPEYQAWISKLNVDRLNSFLPLARAAYEKHLATFTEHLRTKYNMVNTPMSAFTLGNWLVGFLHYPSQISELARLHRRLPRQAVLEMLPEMIAMLDDMPEGRAEWQQAFALMALPLAAERS